MIATAILLGLISSLHCIGMCGPIAMMLPLARHNPEKKALQLMAYHSGRLSAYAAIGLLFGILGRGFYLAGWQQQISIVAGVVMILIALVPEKKLARYNFSGRVYRLLSKVKSALGQRMRNPSAASLYTVGLLNGFLPCALVYAAVFGALASPGISHSIRFMIMFGLGTIPLMSAVVYVQHLVTGKLRRGVGKIIPYAIAGLGMVFILRGLGLDIAFLSPSSMQLFVQAMPDCR